MLRLEDKINDLYSRLILVKEKLSDIQKERDNLASELQESLSLIETLKLENKDLEKRIEESGDRLKEGELDGEMRKELQHYVEVIDECLAHLKKL